MTKNVLVLHGGYTNSEIMKIQSSYLRERIKLIDSDINFIYLEGDIKPVKLPDYINKFDPPYLLWGNSKETLDQSLERIIKKINFSIFGIIGFSQGAYIGHKLLQYFKPKFFISISGMTTTNIMESNNTSIPSIYVIGKNDKYLNLLEKFCSLSDNKLVLYHLGKHDFPFNINVYDKIIIFLLKIIKKS